MHSNLAQIQQILQQTGVVTYFEKNNGDIVQGSNIMPRDDSIPQIDEGNEYFFIDVPITSGIATKFEFEGVFSPDLPTNITVALFESGVNNALASRVILAGGNNFILLSINITLPTDNSIAKTYSIRAGLSFVGALTMNGNPNREMGGTMNSMFRITRNFVYEPL